jgi:RimJ/RimL family protein N-acetyltransferase
MLWILAFLLDEFEGNGYAYEAALKIKSVGMDDFGLKKISAITTKDNFSSQKLIEKLGLKFKNMSPFPTIGGINVLRNRIFLNILFKEFF